MLIIQIFFSTQQCGLFFASYWSVFGLFFSSENGLFHVCFKWFILRLPTLASSDYQIKFYFNPTVFVQVLLYRYVCLKHLMYIFLTYLFLSVFIICVLFIVFANTPNTCFSFCMQNKITIIMWFTLCLFTPEKRTSNLNG